MSAIGRSNQDAGDASFQRLCHRLLDGELDRAERERISALVADDPGQAKELARMALLHDAIERESTVGSWAMRDRRIERRSVRMRRATLVAASILAIATAAAIVLVPNRDAAASQVLAEVVAKMRSGDRTYLVRSIPDNRRSGRGIDDSPLPRSLLRRAELDGAMLFLRPPSSYVLVQTSADGGEVITGSNGRTAWFVSSDGAARVSGDPTRYQGVLPGGRVGVPFVDPHALLAGGGEGSLADAYDLLFEDPGLRDGPSLARIVAVRRSEARGGPKRIVIDFDPRTSLVESIRLENLPQAHGGPRSVEFILVDDSALPPDFFSHIAHHRADRPLTEEP